MKVDVSIPSDRHHVGAVWVKRLEELVHPPGSPERANELHNYEVRLGSKLVGTVEHRYGDGPWALAHKAIGLVAYREATL